jgi:beta-phosphoglucomutase-like phosphatase (HAD superfamily)
MSERIEQLLATGEEVRLGKRDAHEVLRKLRARGAGSEAAQRLEAQLADADEVVLPQSEAQQLLEELKASGRRWISGTDAPRPEPPRKADPEPEPERKSWRFWR